MIGNAVKHELFFNTIAKGIRHIDPIAKALTCRRHGESRFFPLMRVMLSEQAMLIQVAHKDDLADILALQKRAFRKVAVLYKNFSIRPLLVTLSELEDSFPGYVYLKAVDGKRILGSVRASRDGNVCNIEGVIVHPAVQRQGIGTLLMNAIERHCHTCRAYVLCTGKHTFQNVVFYTRLGYEIAEEIPATASTPILVKMVKKNDGIASERPNRAAASL